jgi:hypothetical protein
MQISIGDPRPVRVEYGVDFLITPVRPHGYAFKANALVVNLAISQKALHLLPVAQAIANAKCTRVNFFKRSRESLGVADVASYLRTEQDVVATTLRLEALAALAKGENTVSNRPIGVEQCQEILSFFHQDMAVGAIQAMES